MGTDKNTFEDAARDKANAPRTVWHKQDKSQPGRFARVSKAATSPAAWIEAPYLTWLWKTPMEWTLNLLKRKPPSLKS